MKNLIKTFCIMLCCVLALPLAACDNAETGDGETQQPVNSEMSNSSGETPITSADIGYYSGNTLGELSLTWRDKKFRRTRQLQQ